MAKTQTQTKTRISTKTIATVAIMTVAVFSVAGIIAAGVSGTGTTSKNSIKLISPNQETWIGGTHTISWSVSMSKKNVAYQVMASLTNKLGVTYGFANKAFTASGTSGSGSFSLEGTTLQPGDYKLKVEICTTFNGQLVCSGSNNPYYAYAESTGYITLSTKCTDSDNGLNYGTKGSVTEINNNNKWIPKISTDTCVTALGANLTEYRCSQTYSNGLYYGTSQAYSCPNGCSDGACKLPSSCTTASQCGMNESWSCIGGKCQAAQCGDGYCNACQFSPCPPTAENSTTCAADCGIKCTTANQCDSTGFGQEKWSCINGTCQVAKCGDGFCNACQFSPCSPTTETSANCSADCK